MARFLSRVGAFVTLQIGIASFLGSPVAAGATAFRDVAEVSAGVQATFERYEAAVRDQDGVGAVSCIAAPTLAYYQRVVDLAIDAEPEELRGLDVGIQIDVLKLRGRTSPELIRRLDGERLIGLSVQQGWISMNMPEGISLGTPILDGDRAAVPLFLNGASVGASMEFRLEDGVWKINIASNFDIVEMLHRDAATQAGMPIDVYARIQVEYILRRQVPDSMYEPVGRGMASAR
ncbi:MAG: hypothetical protein AAGB51_01890 [Planctomycetota bacterium]